MKRILITGISGVGKSTVIEELAARGYKSIDGDTDEYSHWVAVTDDSETSGTPVEADCDWVWRTDRIQELLSTEDAEVLFLNGCAPNMGRFLPLFDHVVLLSAPDDVIVERLATRTNNAYGKHPDQVARILGPRTTVEPLLRNISNHEIDTSPPLTEVVMSVLKAVGER